jgi:hypothetical protein
MDYQEKRIALLDSQITKFAQAYGYVSSRFSTAPEHKEFFDGLWKMIMDDSLAGLDFDKLLELDTQRKSSK